VGLTIPHKKKNLLRNTNMSLGLGRVPARTGEKRDAYRLLVGKRPLGRARRRWVDNIKMDLLEID
jgi:hypothetical protein